MRQFLFLPAIALLVSCGQPASKTAQTNLAAPADGAAAQVAALSPRLRAGVLLRAIRDAGQDCQEVVAATRAEAAAGPPAWIATCEDRHRWVVVVTNDGTAMVTDADLITGTH